MDDVSISLPDELLDLLVERTTGRVHASAFVAGPWLESMSPLPISPASDSALAW